MAVRDLGKFPMKWERTKALWQQSAHFFLFGVDGGRK